MEQSKRNTKAAEQGVSIRRVTFLLLLLACILALMTILLVHRSGQRLSALQRAGERYALCRRDARELMQASDDLSELARAFVITGDENCAQRYFARLPQTRDCDPALEEIGEYSSGTENSAALLSAFERAKTLTETECYAMRLKAESLGLSLDDFPEQLRSVSLASADAALSAEGKGARAVELLFGEGYEASRSELRAGVSACLDLLAQQLEREQELSVAHAQRDRRAQTVLILALLALMLLSALLNGRLVFAPLLAGIESIRKNERMQPRGSAEMRFLAGAYNDMLERSRLHQEQLSYDASHDDLTDLYNRGVFERMRTRYNDGSAAMILVDIDKFKEINDLYGHDVGDKTLIRVAQLLKASFRSEDYVCRIGGDELAVIMLHSSSALKELVRDKFSGLNEKLSVPQDGLPKISLSAGVAFGDRENATGDYYRDADTALYRVKENGGCGCGFY